VGCCQKGDVSLTSLGRGQGWGGALRGRCLEGEARPVSAMPMCRSFHADSPVLVPPLALALQRYMGFF